MPIYEEKACITDIQENKITELDLSKHLVFDAKSEAKYTVFGEYSSDPDPALRFLNNLVLCLLPDGRLAGSGAWNGDISIWDFKSGRCTLLRGHSDSVVALCMLPDGNLASSSRDKTIKIWDLKSGLCIATLSGHSDWVCSLTVLPDGRLVSGSADNTIKLWDLVNGLCTTTLREDTTTTALCVLPDGRLACGSYSQIIRLWDIKSGRCEATLDGHSHDITALCMLPDGRLASSSSDNTIKIWDIKNGRCLLTLSGHLQSQTNRHHSIHALCMLSDGRLASGSSDETIKLWNLKSGLCVETLKVGHISTFCVLADGRLAVASTNDTQLWSTGSRALVLANLNPLFKALYNKGYGHTNTSIKSLNLQRCQLTNKDVPALLKLLEQNNTLTSLDLRETGITAEGLRLLSKATLNRPLSMEIMSQDGRLVLPASLKTATTIQEHKIEPMLTLSSKDHQAISTGDISALTLLLNQKEKLSYSCNSENDTLLHLAIRKMQPILTMLLIEHDADTTKKNAAGQTPLDLATASKDPLLIGLFSTRTEAISLAINVVKQQIEANPSIIQNFSLRALLYTRLQKHSDLLEQQVSCCKRALADYGKVNSKEPTNDKAALALVQLPEQIDKMILQISALKIEKEKKLYFQMEAQKEQAKAEVQQKKEEDQKKLILNAKKAKEEKQSSKLEELVNLRKQWGLKSYDELISAYKGWIKASPEKENASYYHRELGLFHLHLGDKSPVDFQKKLLYQEALDNLTIGLKLKPGDDEIAQGYANVEAKLKKQPTSIPVSKVTTSPAKPKLTLEEFVAKNKAKILLDQKNKLATSSIMKPKITIPAEVKLVKPANPLSLFPVKKETTTIKDPKALDTLKAQSKSKIFAVQTITLRKTVITP